jgi:L-iditol 2-dehydrogenase
MLVGNPTSDMLLEKEIYWKILRNQLTVCGTWNSSYDRSSEDDWHYVLNRLENGRIHPDVLISHRFSLADLHQGFWIMRDKSEDYVKIMWG